MIGIAAIGVNHWHSLYDAEYLPLLREMPDVRILAVHDPDQAVATERASAIGNPPAYTDYRRMLAETKPDFVLALGRPTDMAGTAHYLLDNGYPFMAEKPMGFNAEEVRGIAEKARARRAFVALPLPFRYQPQIALAKHIIAEGRLGPLSHISIRNMRPTSARYPAWGAPWMLDSAIANGGCLRNLGPHGLDIFTLLAGEEANVTGAQVSSRALGQDVEDYVSVMLRSSGGIVGNVEVSNLFPGKGGLAEMHICGREGFFAVAEGVARIVTAAGKEIVKLESVARPAALILRDTLDCWRQGKKPPANADDCYRLIRLVDQAYAFARQSQH
jgi:predicted dehydrogenase